MIHDRRDRDRSEDCVSATAHLFQQGNHDPVAHVYLDILARLPVELARAILQLTCSTPPFDSSSMLPSPLLVASVCRAWRAIALADPMLWANLFIAGYNESHFTMCLQRSSDAPLDITITRVVRDGKTPSIIGTLNPLIHRWRRLRIYTTRLRTLRAAISRISGVALILEELVIRHDEAEHKDIEAIPVPFLFTFPQLRVLSIDWIVFKYIFDMDQSLAWPVNTLRSLSILHPSRDHHSPPILASIHTVLTVGAKSRALRSLSLGNFIVNDHARQSQATNYPLLALQRVTFDHIRTDVIHDFFRLADTPSLDIIEIVDSPEIPRGLGNLSFFRFRTLRLVNTGNRPTTNNIRPLLLDCDNLYISEVRDFDDSVIFAMSSSRGPPGISSWMCPHLVSLEIHRCFRFSVASLRKLVSVRQDASLDPTSHVAAIKRLVVHTPPRISKEDRAWFSEHLEFFSWSYETKPQVRTSNVRVYEPASAGLIDQ